MSVVTPVSEDCYDVSLNFCAMSQLSQGDSNKPAVMQKSALYLSLSSLRCAWSLTELTVATLSFLLSSPVCTGSHRPVLARRPAGPGEHMVTSMGNIIMICIRQQSAQNIASAQECLCKIKCFRFYAIILSRPPPVINQSIWKIYNSLNLIWSLFKRGFWGCVMTVMMLTYDGDIGTISCPS